MKLPNWMNLNHLPKPLRLACLVSTGGFVGLAACVFAISNAGSYMSDDPKACINCHIMVPQYATWKHSSHGRNTTCNDCHVPHDSVFNKYWFKANDGLRHSTLFTLRMEPQVIKAREEAKHVIQANCVRCHIDNIENVAQPAHSASDRSCVECHREVPHGRVNSLSSTPNAAVPPLESLTKKFSR